MLHRKCRIIIFIFSQPPTNIHQFTTANGNDYNICWISLPNQTDNLMNELFGICSRYLALWMCVCVVRMPNVEHIPFTGCVWYFASSLLLFRWLEPTTFACCSVRLTIFLAALRIRLLIKAGVFICKTCMESGSLTRTSNRNVAICYISAGCFGGSSDAVNVFCVCVLVGYSGHWLSKQFFIWT